MLPHCVGKCKSDLSSSSSSSLFSFGQIMSIHWRWYGILEFNVPLDTNTLETVQWYGLWARHTRLTRALTVALSLHLNTIWQRIPYTDNTFTKKGYPHTWYITIFVFRAMLCIARSLLWQRVRLSVHPSVCRTRYYVQATKPILKLLRPSGSSIIGASLTPCTDTQFQGKPLSVGC